MASQEKIMLEDYKKHCEERREQGIPPLPFISATNYQN
jgi:aconitase B